MSETKSVTILPFRTSGSGITTYSLYLVKALIKTDVDLQIIGFGEVPEFIRSNGINFRSLGEDPFRLDYLGGPYLTYTYIKERIRKEISTSLASSEVIHYLYPAANVGRTKENVHPIATAWGFGSIRQIIKNTARDFSPRLYPLIAIGKSQYFYMDYRSYKRSEFIVGTTTHTLEFWRRKIKNMRSEYVPLPVATGTTVGTNYDKSLDSDKVSFLIGERDLDRPRNNVVSVIIAFENLFNRGVRNFRLYLVGRMSKNLYRTISKLKDRGMDVVIDSYLDRGSFQNLLGMIDVAIVVRDIFDQGGYWPLEAMANGCCVVATDSPAFRDFVLEGETGVLVDSSSVVTLTEKLEELIQNREFLSLLKKNARKFVETNHSLSAVGKLYSSIYSRVMQRTESEQ